MARISANADTYANDRLNVFFPGIVPSLDGQCVSLVKGFMQDMTEVPNPQAARGDARYVGHTLVNQGHAKEVAFADRRRGDIVTYESGVYGHIGIILSRNRTFEQNVNLSGVSRKLIKDGNESWYVYASRIGSMSEAWRKDIHIYRINTYTEDNDMPRLPIPPEIAAQHYINYSHGLVKMDANSPACQNRFEDTVDDEFWYGLNGHISNLLKSELAYIPDTHRARLMAVEYGVDFAGDHPDLIAAVGKSEKSWRKKLAQYTSEKIAKLQEQVDNGSGPTQEFVETKVYTPKEK